MRNSYTIASAIFLNTTLAGCASRTETALPSGNSTESLIGNSGADDTSTK
jgi:hypothetical protein